MSLGRDELLRELELLPVWVPRQEAVSPVDATPAEAPAAVVTAREASLPPITARDDDARLVQIAKLDWPALPQAVADCQACGLAHGRTRTVFGVGDPDADWLLVGEAPGMEEDRRGEPFVGQAGKLLDNMLAAIGLRRGRNVYIANVVKCRPPGNRNPQDAEIAACLPFLRRQVELVSPRLIVAFGRVAAQTLLGSDGAIASLRGKRHDYAGIPVIVTYHPAYLLRNPADKARAWEDLCFAVATMDALTGAD